jgi:rhodanese-related sulfurtransferase
MSYPDGMPIEIDVLSVKSMLDGQAEFLLLDCRRTDEYEVARIDQAKLIPMDELAERIDELEAHKDGRVVVHCHHGGRSLMVARWLREQGFGRAQSMAGGIEAWSVLIDPDCPRY